MSSPVTISDTARAITALSSELAAVDMEQLEVAAQMSAVMARQVILSRKSNDLHAALSKLVRNFSER